ncbi:MAG: FimB/Mfa2 family fimbrial subunit [Sphingobacteriaceae bacterium]
MRELLFTTMVCCLLFFSCKKDGKSNKDATLPNTAKYAKYAVKFKVSGFDQSVEGFSVEPSSKLLSSSKVKNTAVSSLNNIVKYLYYIAYNSNGEEASRIFQDSTGHTYKVFPNEELEIREIGVFPLGNITDSLSEGTYTIVFAGTYTDIGINSRNQFGYDLRYSPLNEASFTYTRGLDSWSRSSDSFFKKTTIVVGSENAENAISLERIVGKVEIVIQDIIPANASKFSFQFVNENEGYKFSDEKPIGETYDFDEELEPYLRTAIKASEVAQANYTFRKYIINTTTTLTVIINCYDASGALIATKTVNNVQCYKNKRTILKGKLFCAGDAATSFAVTVNPEWNTQTDEISF